jgi:phosphoglycerate dehydrogenase-like enzyme
VSAERGTLIVGIHHPVDVDVEALSSRVAQAARPIEIRALPFKESLRVRMARRDGPLPAELAAKAPTPPPEILALWRECEALCVLDLPGEALDQMPALQFVQAYSSGVEHLRPDLLEARSIALASAAGVGAAPIAEFALGRLLEVWKGTRQLEHMQRERHFTRPASRVLEGSTLGIVGLGAIGSALARRAQAFGMRVVATRRHPERGGQYVDALVAPNEVGQLLAESDAVVLCAPETDETRDLIDAEALATLRPGAVLCNVARGGLVDEEALCEALETGHLAAAILDVTREEPLPEGHRLWDAPNLYLSPHCAAAPEAYDARLIELFVRNLLHFAAGEPLENQVPAQGAA